MAHPSYKLTLQNTYYAKGFFNLGVDIERYVAGDGAEITLVLGPKGQRMAARVNRRANQNGTPRIMGGARLRDWFIDNCEMMDQLTISVISPTELKITNSGG